MIDLALVIAFVAYSMRAGLRARRQASRGLHEYFLAGRSFSAWQSGFSMTATQYAADTPLLAAGLVATGGIFALWRLWIYGVAFLLLGFLLGSAWWRSGVVTDAELCELRYGGRAATVLRGVKAVYYGLICNCAVLAMVLVAAVRIAEPFLLWHEWLPQWMFEPLVGLVRDLGVRLAADRAGPDVWVHSASNLLSVVLIFTFTLLYSATGGLRGVVATDMMQLAVVFVATGAYAWYAADAVGGFGALRDRLVQVVGSARADRLLAFEPSAAVGVTGSLLAVFGMQWLLERNSDGTGYLAQRTMACRSEAHARRAPVIFAFTQVVLRSLLWLPILVALLVQYPLEDVPDKAARELTFVRGIEDLLPEGFRGLMLVGLLAALASTLDTHLNWGSSYLANDLYGRVVCRGLLRREPRPRSLVWVARLANPLLVIIALVVMTRLDSIQQAWHVTLLFGAGLGIPLLLRWLWHRANAWGELAAIVASAVAAPILLSFPPTQAAEPIRLLVIAGVATLAAVVATLATAPVDRAQLKVFYERVRPPGFWNDPAALVRLRRGMAGLIAAAGSLFTALVGLGTMMVAGTPPAFLPHRGAWIAANLTVSLTLVPVWWRLLVAGETDSETD